jgi:hypothetical protein
MRTKEMKEGKCYEIHSTDGYDYFRCKAVLDWGRVVYFGDYLCLGIGVDSVKINGYFDETDTPVRGFLDYGGSEVDEYLFIEMVNNFIFTEQYGR